MKYIRTKDGIYEVEEWFKPLENDIVYIPNEGLNKILNQANTIEELCDEFVIETDREKYVYNKGFRELQREYDVYDSGYGLLKIINKYGAIWTDKGLIYVAKMNEKGELKLL